MNAASDQSQEVLAAEANWTQAHRTLDIDTLERMLAEDYFRVEADGRLLGKQELLQSYRSGERHWEVAESDRHHVAILGDVAVLNGRWRGKGTNAGVRFDYVARFLAVYVKKDGRWQLFTEQSTPIELD